MASAEAENDDEEKEDTSRDAPTSDLYELVHRFCNLGAVQDLLRKYRLEVAKDKRSDVRVSGDNKKEIITGNLRRAVEAGLIPVGEVHALLQNGEENGRQHIFLFKPLNAEVRKVCQDGEAIAVALFGKTWRTSKGFPKFDLALQQYVWADFRIGLPGKPKDWVAKLYGVEEKVEFVKDEDEEERDDDNFAKVYHRRPVRMICLARWNNDDMLEIRVPVSSGAKDAARRRDIVWLHLRKGLGSAGFTSWPLPAAMKAMLVAEKKAKEAVEKKQKGAELEVFESGDKQFVDEENNTATFSMQVASGSTTEEDGGDEEEDVELPTIAESTKTATDAYIENDDDCQRLILYWASNDLNGLKKPLRTQLGTKAHPNELIVFSKVGRKALDYVLNQLRRFVD